MARIIEYGRGMEKGGDRFPFRVMRLTGWALLILSVITFILGIVDVGWTAGNYTRNSCNTQGWEPDNKPCDEDSEADELIWTWVSAPIWASFFIIITGIIGTRFSSWNTENLRFHRDMFTVMCVLVCLLWGPAIITLTSLELYYGMDIFYMIEDGSLKMQDTAKFVLPLIIAIVTFFAWLAAIVGVCVGCCCAPVQDFDEYGSIRRLRPSSELEVYHSRDRGDRYYDSYPRRSRSYREPRGGDRDMIPFGGNVMGPPIIMPPSGGGYGGMSAGYPGMSMGGYGGYTSPYGYYGGAYGGANYGAQSAYGASPYAGYASYGGYGRAASASPYF